MISIGASSADMDRGLRDARKKLRSFGADAKKTVGGLGKKALGGGLGMLGAGFGIQAAGGLTEMVTEVFDVEKALTRLQIAGSMSAAELESFRQQTNAVSRSTGVARGEIVKGAAAYLAMTGDAKGAAEASQLFAEIAAGSGAGMEDIAKSAAALRQNLKIDPKDFRQAFDVLIKQGQLGAVEISDLSQQLAAIAPQFANFAGSKTVSGMADLGAMLQVVRQGFGSVEEAGTGFRGLMTQIEKNQKKLKKAGINIIDPKTGKMRDMLGIVRQIAANKALQAPGKLFEVLGEAKAVQALGLLIGKLDEVDQIKRDSLGSDQVAKNNAIWQASSAGKIAKAWETVKVSLAEAFTPERIEKFAKVLGQAADIMAKIVGFTGDVIDFLDTASDPAGAERTGAEVAAQRQIVDKMGLSPEARKAELGRRALAMEAGTGSSMFGNQDNNLEAAQILAKEAGIILARDDSWAKTGNGAVAPAMNSPEALQRALTDAIARAKIVVNLDGGVVGKRIENSPNELKSPKR